MGRLWGRTMGLGGSMGRLWGHTMGLGVVWEGYGVIPWG